MDFHNLDETTRGYMLKEIEKDIDQGILYRGKNLSQAGKLEWPNLIKHAAKEGTPDTLAHSVSSYILPEETYVRAGVERVRRTAANAAERLAEGEFNRFYMRAVCRRAIDEGAGTVKAYRSRPIGRGKSAGLVRNQRPRSEPATTLPRCSQTCKRTSERIPRWDFPQARILD